MQKCSDLNKEHTLLIRPELKVISNTLWGLEQSLWVYTYSKGDFSEVFCGLKLMKGEKKPMEHEWKLYYLINPSDF